MHFDSSVYKLYLLDFVLYTLENLTLEKGVPSSLQKLY